MLLEHQQGSVINIQGLECHIPPTGYVYNVITKKLEQREIYKRSDIESEQYWERIPLPSWYKEVIKKEDEYLKKKKEDDPQFYDERYEKFKQQQWDRRLNGMWFMNNGKPVYITGFYYMLLQWFSIDIGFAKFTIPHLHKTYFLQYCIEDPLCMGMIDVTKRRFLKTFMGGLFILEYTTRTKMANGGLQSKTGNDAKKVFGKAIVYPFRKFPRFFRPEYDMSLGVNPKTELRFQQTNIRGKKAEDSIDKDELGSMIDWGSADPVHYDGSKLHRYFSDEWGKCFSKGTKIRMFDGSIKNVENIVEGDLVMGDDSSPRRAYGITNGRERMYRIIPHSGNYFECNESHILSLKVPTQKEPIAMSVKEFISLKDWEKRNYMIWKVGVEYAEVNHFIDPYFLGVWLGDGNSRCAGFSSNDNKVIEYMESVSDANGLFFRRKSKYDYHISSGKVGKNNVILSELKRLELIENKHIPAEYLIDSRRNRLKLLAGLLDTDGNIYNRNGISLRYEITQKRKELATNIQELANSCGFKATLYKRVATMVRKDGSVYKCDVYKVCIYGEIYEIPCKIERKIAKKTEYIGRRKNPLRSGFTIEPIGEGDYYGFAVDGNHLFLLSDYTVVHNTTEANIFDRHEVIRYCLLDEEGNIIGKCLYSTTVEKLESDKDGVQDAAKDLWNASDQNNREENGRTQSGLYRFFQTSDEGRNFDKYGYPNVEKTIKDILADRESVKNNPRSLSARMRKEPRTIEEAFSDDGDKCVFNIIKIMDREKWLSENNIPKREVIFWMDESTQRVKWRDANKSEKDFCWRLSPDAELGLFEDNKSYVDAGVVKPGRKKFGAISVDSYSNSQGGRKYGSKASAWVGRKYDPLNPNSTGKPVGHLYGRPREKDELHRQVMLGGIFFGFEIFYEHTADDYDSYFRERGKRGYLGLYPWSLIDVTKRNKETVERHRGTPITPFSLTKQLDNGIAYFEKYCDKLDFEEIFPPAKKFDPYKRTEYDAIVSLLILLTVLFEPEYTPPPPKTPLIKVYQNNHTIAATI